MYLLKLYYEKKRKIFSFVLIFFLAESLTQGFLTFSGGIGIHIGLKWVKSLMHVKIFHTLHYAVYNVPRESHV